MQYLQMNFALTVAVLLYCDGRGSKIRPDEKKVCVLFITDQEHQHVEDKPSLSSAEYLY